MECKPMKKDIKKILAEGLLNTIEKINYKTIPDKELFKLYNKLPIGFKQLSYQELEELESLLKVDSLNDEDEDRLEHYLNIIGYEDIN